MWDLVGCPGVALGLLKPATPARVIRESFLLVAIVSYLVYSAITEGDCVSLLVALGVPLLGRSRCSAPPWYCYISSLPNPQ